jgi:hypothetical protein
MVRLDGCLNDKTPYKSSKQRLWSQCTLT